MAEPKGSAFFDCKISSMKSIISAALCVLMAIHSSAQKNVLQSQWRDSVITIDGNSSDWSHPLPYADSKIKAQIGVRNDGSFLYLCLSTSDEQTQLKIMRAGMTVGFDVKGNKKQLSAIQFPLPSNATMELPEPGNDEQPKIPDFGKVKREALVAQKELHTQKLVNIPDGNLPLDNSLDIRAAINWDKDNVLCYELKIPLGTFYKETISATDTDRLINLCIIINGLTLPPPPVGMEGPPDGGMGGGPGGPPGGMGGPPSGGMGDMPPGLAKMFEMAKSLETCIRFRLRYK